jgi:hypothetical protein
MILLGLAQAGCGYTLQNSHNELLEKQGIERIYVKPLTNNTYKPGVENTVYNALIRTILTHRRVRLVTEPSSADAVLTGIVTQAQFGVTGTSSANGLYPVTLSSDKAQIKHYGPSPDSDLSRISIATIYTATLGCDLTLDRRIEVRGKRTKIWLGSFLKSKPFPASNQLDVPGTTSALINESEFERALGEIAVNMMDEVHESMLSMF